MTEASSDLPNPDSANVAFCLWYENFCERIFNEPLWIKINWFNSTFEMKFAVWKFLSEMFLFFPLKCKYTIHRYVMTAQVGNFLFFWELNFKFSGTRSVVYTYNLLGTIEMITATPSIPSLSSISNHFRIEFALKCLFGPFGGPLPSVLIRYEVFVKISLGLKPNYQINQVCSNRWYSRFLT